MKSSGGLSKQFFLWDYDSTLFPLRTNRLLVERFSKETLLYIQKEVPGGGFQNQHRVFATKRGWFLRPTVKLDPVCEYFFYDFIYRNRSLFGKPPIEKRGVLGYRIVNGDPIPILKSYSQFKKLAALYRQTYKYNAYFDLAAYFNRIYHHDLVRWFEDAGGAEGETQLFGKFLRETAAGRSIDCLPQGIYPSKMVGSAFLGFIENSNRITSAQTLRLMDDVWLFDNDPRRLATDFLRIQSLLSDRGLTVNEEKSRVLESRDHQAELPFDIGEMKAQLLRKRRERFSEAGGYGDEGDSNGEGEEDGEELEDLAPEEQEYLLSLLKGQNLQEEDAELVLTLMRDHSTDVVEFIPTLVRDFPGLAKRLYYFCANVDDKTEIVSAIAKYLSEGIQVTEYQLFWFGMMVEAYLLKSPGIGELLRKLYEHDGATDISRAKILEIPDKRFGLPDLRDEQLRTGHSDWLAWSAAVGARSQPKGTRNQLLKYFRKSSPMNRHIGEFVETCF